MSQKNKEHQKVKRILLIDDEEDMDWVMNRILTDDGYEVVTARTGADGLAKFLRDPKSAPLVILDVQLPDMNGLELLKQIKKIYSRTKVLVVTAFGTPELRKLAKKAGALAVFDKPFSVEKVLKAARLAFEVVGGGRDR